MRHQRGFTLIELSIVLVIIGLVVGGVVVGKQLIEVAELRATVTQLEKFRTAVNTFRNKYGQLPGDMPATRAAQFGLFQITGNCGATCPYGNGTIEYGGSPVLVFEYNVFWRHLVDANLIEPISFATLQASDGNSSTYESLAPRVKHIPDRFWNVRAGLRYSTTGDEMQAGGNDFVNFDLISPIETQLIDNKIDDGKPRYGTVVENWASMDGSWAATPGPLACTYGGADQYALETVYNIDPSIAGNNRDLCAIYIKSGF